MKVVAIIQARMGSTRLPNKVLMPILGKPILGWMLERVSSCKHITDVIVATTTNDQDNVIADFSEKKGYKVFRGSEDDVLDRYYQASKMVDAEHVVRLTSDCPLIDPEIVSREIEKHIESGNDFTSNSEPLPATVPDGMDVSIMSSHALKRAWLEAKKPSEREHVTFYFWNNPLQFKCSRSDLATDLSSFRITLDYEEDYQVIKSIIEFFMHSRGSLEGVGMDEILEYLKNNPEVFRLNTKYVRGMGWQSAFEKDKM